MSIRLTRHNFFLLGNSKTKFYEKCLKWIAETQSYKRNVSNSKWGRKYHLHAGNIILRGRKVYTPIHKDKAPVGWVKDGEYMTFRYGGKRDQTWKVSAPLRPSLVDFTLPVSDQFRCVCFIVRNTVYMGFWGDCFYFKIPDGFNELSESEFNTALLAAKDLKDQFYKII